MQAYGFRAGFFLIGHQRHQQRLAALSVPGMDGAGHSFTLARKAKSTQAKSKISESLQPEGVSGLRTTGGSRINIC